MIIWNYEQHKKFPASILVKNLDAEPINRWIIVIFEHRIEDTI